MIRVAVVDDQELVRAGIVFMLRSHDEIEIVGEAGDGEEAVALVTGTAPDVVLIDVRLPSIDGIEATWLETFGHGYDDMVRQWRDLTVRVLDQ